MKHPFNIQESERNEIKNLYNFKKEENYVFDFVITENNKYLILMDQVFVANSDGKSIGSIWENTYIFDELLKDSLKKIIGINESIETKINEIFKNISWKKEDILEWVKDSSIITEETNFIDNIISGAKEIGGKVMSSVSGMAMSAFKQGILPALRWIRKNAYTSVGVVVDAVIAFFSFKSTSAIWFLIVALDIYEIATGDFDKNDPNRKNEPYSMLISDLLSAVLTAGFGLLFRKAAPTIMKQGIKNPNIKNALKKLLDKIPTVKGYIVNVLNVVSKKMPTAKKIIDKIISSIDKVLSNLVLFIRRLFSREGIGAAQSGATAFGVHKGIEYINKPKTSNQQKQQTEVAPDESDIIKDAKRLGLI